VSGGVLPLTSTSYTQEKVSKKGRDRALGERSRRAWHARFRRRFSIPSGVAGTTLRKTARYAGKNFDPLQDGASVRWIEAGEEERMEADGRLYRVHYTDTCHIARVELTLEKKCPRCDTGHNHWLQKCWRCGTPLPEAISVRFVRWFIRDVSERRLIVDRLPSSAAAGGKPETAAQVTRTAHEYARCGIVCDICNKTLSSYEGSRVPAATMTDAARRGFNPHKHLGVDPDINLKTLTEMALEQALGGSKDQRSDAHRYTLWHMRIVMTTTDWMLCGKCHSAFQQFAHD
jgi:hypothetical protein